MKPWITAVAGQPRFLVLAAAPAVYAYVGLWVDPSVFYEAGPYFPAFHYGTEFLGPFVLQPGGPSRYVAAYLAQACANRWFGAGVFTALAMLLGMAYGLCLRHALGKRAADWGMLAAGAALLVWTRYGLHLGSITALALALVGAAAYTHPRWDRVRSAGARAGAGMGLFALCYCICGAAVYPCILLAAAVEHGPRQRPRLAAALLLGGILLPPLLGHIVLDLPLEDAVTAMLPFSDPSRLEGGVSLCLLYAAAVLPALMLFLRGAAVDTSPSPAGDSPPSSRRRWGRLSPAGRRAVGLVAAGVALVLARPTHTARRMAAMKHFRAGRWECVLAEAAAQPRTAFTLDLSYAVNQALYHTRALGERMFAFPQSPLSLTLGTAFATAPDQTVFSEGPKAFFDLGTANLDMGLANEAEHLAHEALEIHGPHPTVLKQLVEVNLAKGRMDAARVFLRALCRDPVAGAWARGRLAAMAASPAAVPDLERIAAVRRNLPVRRDFHAPRMSLEERCLAQLEENPANRMALEFLLAHYLVTHDLDGFVRALPRLRARGEASLPRHYQEAVLLYEGRTGRALPEWDVLVGPEVREQFRRFRDAVAARADPPRLGETTLKAMDAFLDTYFFHFVYQGGE
ncbi:MAG: hypothetical protein JXR77_03860 [Lentisphaeria bacterium]|nr:hypothetical protein [Lentisphaeria bacterium]